MSDETAGQSAKQEELKLKLKKAVASGNFSETVKEYFLAYLDVVGEGLSVPVWPVMGIDPNHDPIDQYLATRTIPGGTTQLLAQGTAQAIGALGLMAAVPAGVHWQVDYIICDYTASATVGNRVLYGRMTDSNTAVMWSGLSSANVVATAIANYDVMMGGGTVGTGVRRTIPGTANTTVGIREVGPKTVFGPASRFIVQDAAGIDTADTFSYAIYGTVLPL